MKHILLIDKELKSSELLSMVLKEHNILVNHFSNYKDALESIKIFKYDLIVAEIFAVGEMLFIEFIEELRKVESYTTILLHSTLYTNNSWNHVANKDLYIDTVLKLYRHIESLSKNDLDVVVNKILELIK